MKKAHAPLLCLALAMLAGSAPAQFDSGGGSSSNDDKPAWEQFAFNPKTRIKLNFRNANIDMVLALFEKTSGVSIVKDPALTGPISLTSAKPISLKDAFQILGTTLQLKGYELRKDGKILVIAKKQERPPREDRGGGGFDFSQLQQPDSVLKVYPIQYANASQVARVVNDVFGTQIPSQNQNPFQRGRGRGGQPQQQPQGNPFARQDPPIRASSDDFSNTVIVNAPDRQQRYVSDLIKQIDKQTDDPQRTRVYKLVYASAEDVQPVLQNVLTANAPKGRGGATTAVQAQQNLPFFLRGANAGQGQGSVTAEQRTNSVIVTATGDNLKLTDQLVDELDKPVDIASTTFVFPLLNARAEDVASLLGQAFGTRSGVNGNNRGITSPQQQRRNTNTTARNNNNNGLGRAQSQTRAGGGANSADPEASAKSETTIPIAFEDPNSDEGELQTSVAVSQGRNFRNAFGQNNGRNGQNNNPNTTARDAQGRIVNVSDLTNQITVIPDNNTNSVIVVGSPDAANLVQSILGQLDRIPEQVMIETIIVEATLDDTTRLGVEFGLNIPKVFGTAGSINGGTDFGLANANPPLQGGRVTLSGGNLTGFLNAIRTDNRFNILSTPRIFTSNNQEAQINISQSIPYVLSTRQDIAGGLQFNYAFLDVGIVLTVTPRITANGYVTMDVSQTANDLQSFTSFNAPIVNQREANTSVSVLDGETIVLGGIIRSTVTASSNKVPILGDIPIIGNLFKSTSRTNAKTELLVLLTPRIVRDDAEARKLRIEQQNRLSKPTQDQLRNTLPPEQAPTKEPGAPDNAPGSGAGGAPGKTGTPPPTTSR